MLKGSPFCIQTNLGRLELTKGAFLTLQRRNCLALHTAAKTKPIAKEHTKTTVKRRHQEHEVKCTRYRQIRLKNRQGRNIRFSVAGEGERLRWKESASLPTKEMSCDNDDESEWIEI